MKKIIFFILRVAVGLGIILVLFNYIPYSELVPLYQESKKIYIVIAFIAFILLHFVAVLRWRFLLLSLGLKCSLKETGYSFFSSLFFNLFFPSLLGGDAFRATAVGYRQGQIAKSASSVIMDRFSGAFSLSLISCTAFILGRKVIKEETVFLSVLAFLALNILFIIIVFNRTLFNFLNRRLKKGFVKEKIVHFYNELYFFRENPKVFIKSLRYSLIIQAATCISFYLISKAFYADINILYFFILVPIIMFIALIPITVAGIGTREAAAVYFLAKVGVDESLALGMSLVNLSFFISVCILGGIVYVMVYHRWLESRP